MWVGLSCGRACLWYASFPFSRYWWLSALDAGLLSEHHRRSFSFTLPIEYVETRKNNLRMKHAKFFFLLVFMRYLCLTGCWRNWTQIKNICCRKKSKCSCNTPCKLSTSHLFHLAIIIIIFSWNLVSFYNIIRVHI